MGPEGVTAGTQSTGAAVTAGTLAGLTGVVVAALMQQEVKALNLVGLAVGTLVAFFWAARRSRVGDSMKAAATATFLAAAVVAALCLLPLLLIDAG